MDIHTFSQKTKQEAESLLEQGNVLEVLSKHGKVVLSGSFAHDLMWDADIDLVVVSDTPYEDSYNALKDFVEQRKFQKYQLGDFISFPLKNRTDGIIIVLIHEYNGRRWEIEIWFRTSLPQENIYFDRLLATASKEQKETILELKSQREAAGISKRSLASTTLYQGVLAEGKLKIEDF